MKSIQIKTVGGEIVTQFFPENEEDREILDRMKNEGQLEQVDGFQSDTPLSDLES
jgi:hypothetical protein